jgi:hypothetical protein
MNLQAIDAGFQQVKGTMARSRLYIDYNATAPLLPAARSAMIEAMDLPGNPSSVHGEGRAARAVISRARDAVARLAGVPAAQVSFTSGATEAANHVLTPDFRMGRSRGSRSRGCWSRRSSIRRCFPAGGSPRIRSRCFKVDGERPS